MSKVDWVRLTTNALDTLRAAERDIWERNRDRCWYIPGHPDGEQLEKDIKRAHDWYEHCVMSAWKAYRPEGPLAGEVLPGEVERITANRVSP